MSCGGGRNDFATARTQAPKGMNGWDLTGWDGEQRGLGVKDSGSRGIVVVVFTSLQLLEWDGKGKDGSHESEESDGSDGLHVGVFGGFEVKRECF